MIVYRQQHLVVYFFVVAAQSNGVLSNVTRIHIVSINIERDLRVIGKFLPRQ